MPTKDTQLLQEQNAEYRQGTQKDAVADICLALGPLLNQFLENHRRINNITDRKLTQQAFDTLMEFCEWLETTEEEILVKSNPRPRNHKEARSAPGIGNHPGVHLEISPPVPLDFTMEKPAVGNGAVTISQFDLDIYGSPDKTLFIGFSTQGTSAVKFCWMSWKNAEKRLTLENLEIAGVPQDESQLNILMSNTSYLRPSVKIPGAGFTVGDMIGKIGEIYTKTLIPLNPKLEATP